MIDDFVAGAALGVTVAPTFFVNGVRHVGSNDADALLATIEFMSTEPVAVGRRRVV